MLLDHKTGADHIIAAKSGVTFQFGPRGSTGALVGAASGLESRFQGEVMHAACRIGRDKADEIMRLAYDKYKDDIAKKPYGVAFWEVYDVATIKPKDEWLKVYEDVKNEAIGWGLPMDQV